VSGGGANPRSMTVSEGSEPGTRLHNPPGFTGRLVGGLVGEGLLASFPMREHPTCPTVLVWEPYRQLGVGAEDVHTRFYRWLGLRPSRRGVLSTSGPWLQTLRLTLTAKRASVVSTVPGVNAIRRKVPEHRGLRAGEEWDSFSLAGVAPVTVISDDGGGP
jgi:hypothetical protein